MTAQNTLPDRQNLEKKYNSARFNLLLVVAFTAVNIILLVTNSNSYFLFSAYVPYMIADLGMYYCGMYPDEFYGKNFTKADALSPSIFAVFIVIALIVLALYLVSWLLSKKKAGWLIFALVFFAVDTVLMFVILGVSSEHIIDIIFHALVIGSLAMGINANYKLKNLPPVEVVLMTNETAEDTKRDMIK